MVAQALLPVHLPNAFHAWCTAKSGCATLQAGLTPGPTNPDKPLQTPRAKNGSGDRNRTGLRGL